MGTDSFRGFKVLTVVRGDALRPGSAPLQVAVADPSVRRTTASPLQAPEGRDASMNSIYGVPVSAVQHCCGRGCKHCRIYWHRSNP